MFPGFLRLVAGADFFGSAFSVFETELGDLSFGLNFDLSFSFLKKFKAMIIFWYKSPQSPEENP